MSPHFSIPDSIWDTVPPEAQAAILVVIAASEKRIADLEARLNQNSTNSSKPPSSDPPAVKVERRPPAPPSGRKRGRQPGHQRHTRALARQSNSARPSRSSLPAAGAVMRRSVVRTPIRCGTRSPKSRPFAPTSMNTGFTD